jgi:hypothetical protein
MVIVLMPAHAGTSSFCPAQSVARGAAREPLYAIEQIWAALSALRIELGSADRATRGERAHTFATLGAHVWAVPRHRQNAT